MPGLGAAALVVVAILAFNVVRQPPAVSPDGGWPAGDAAAQRVLDDLAGGADATLVLQSLPAVKSAEALKFPLVRRGALVEDGDARLAAGNALPLVLLCDAVFAEAIGAPCGGPAEDAVVGGLPISLVDRFQAAPDRWVSVYRPA